jgi:iron(III) transport system permease protein
MNGLLLKNSLLVSALATLLAVGLGFMAALCLAGLGRGWRSLFLGLAVMALALPPFLVTNSWMHFLGHAGVWHSWLPLDIYSLGGAVWLLGLLLWPIPLLAALSAWQRLEPAQLESDMAVTGWALLRVLLWPIARTALGLATVLVFVLALNNFAVPALLQLKVFPAEVWIEFNTTFDAAGALRLSWPLLAAPLLLLAWLGRKRLPWPHLQSAVSPQLFRQQLGPAWFWPCAAGTVFLCLLSAVLPVVQILTVKRTWTELPGALAASQSAVWNSFWFAALGATLIVGLALLAIPRRFPRVQIVFGVLLWLPFLIPGVLLGIALITVFNRPWSELFYQSAGIVVLAFVIRYLALGWTAVTHASQSVDRDLRDVACLEGAPAWQTLRHVYWPQMAPQLGAAWYIVFLLCLWDVESMLLVVPPGGETLALRIFNLLHYGHNAQVNALCFTLLMLALAPLLAWGIFCAGRNLFARAGLS